MRSDEASFERTISRLEGVFPGRVILAAHPEYDSARSVYFTGVDRRPAAIVRPRTAEEVAQVVRVARAEGTRLCVKGGGHGFASRGVIDQAIVVDLSEMRSIEVDPVSRVARAQAGLTTGGYTVAVAESGLATGFGDSPDVGLAGISLAGGIGFLHRKFGLTVDSLLGAQIVTAAGEVIEVNRSAHPDLYWALRGGGGNFGVVTRLDLRLHPVDQVIGGMLMAPADPQTVHEVLELFMEAPEEVSGLLQIFRAPPMPMIPPELHGKTLLGIFLAHSGEIAEGEQWVGRLRQIAKPVVDALEATRYVKLFDHEGGPPPPPLLRWRSAFRGPLTIGEVEGIMDALQEEHSGIMRTVQLRPLGGAVSRVPSEETAFAHRKAPLLTGVGCIYGNPAQAEEHTEWVSSVDNRLNPTESVGCYAGFVGEDDTKGVEGIWPAAHRARLWSIKNQYDPENFFRGNAEIPR